MQRVYAGDNIPDLNGVSLQTTGAGRRITLLLLFFHGGSDSFIVVPAGVFLYNYAKINQKPVS